MSWLIILYIVRKNKSSVDQLILNKCQYSMTATFAIMNLIIVMHDHDTTIVKSTYLITYTWIRMHEY
jgi:hypothetical protein